MYLPNAMRRARRSSTTPSAARVAGWWSQPRMAKQVADRYQADRLPPDRPSKDEVSSSRSPPSTCRRTSPARRRGATVSAASPTAARRFAPCCVVAFVFESVGSVARLRVAHVPSRGSQRKDGVASGRAQGANRASLRQSASETVGRCVSVRGQAAAGAAPYAAAPGVLPALAEHQAQRGGFHLRNLVALPDRGVADQSSPQSAV